MPHDDFDDTEPLILDAMARQAGDRIRRLRRKTLLEGVKYWATVIAATVFALAFLTVLFWYEFYGQHALRAEAYREVLREEMHRTTPR